MMQENHLAKLNGALSVLHSLKLREEAEKQKLEDAALGVFHAQDLGNLKKDETQIVGFANELVRRVEGHPSLDPGKRIESYNELKELMEELNRITEEPD